MSSKSPISITQSRQGTEIVVSAKELRMRCAQFIPLLLIPIIILLNRFHAAGTERLSFGDICLNILMGVLLHELLHTLLFGLFSAKGFKSISLGPYWKEGVLFKHTTEEMRMWKYRIIRSVPGILLGILPLLYGTVMGYHTITILGTIFTCICLGDFSILWKLRSFHSQYFITDRS